MNQEKAKDSIKLKKDSETLSGIFTFEEEGRVALFSPSNPLPQNQTLTLTISSELEDLSGNKLSEEFSQEFIYTGTDLIIYDRVEPEVEEINLISSKFFIEFSEEIEPATISNAIELSSSSGTIAGTSSLENSKTIVFTPSTTLSRNVQYTIKVKPAVKDLSGKSLTEQFSKSFAYTGADLLLFEKPDPNERKESTIGNTTLFHGREYDPETGLYYFRARYYHPELGRFLSPDPNGYEDSMNPNQSFLNNPVNFSDPYGAQVVEVTPKGAIFKAERGLTVEEAYLMWLSTEQLSREEVLSGKVSGSRRRRILRSLGLSTEEIKEAERRLSKQELSIEFVDRPEGKPLILDEKAKNSLRVYNALAKVVLNRDIRLGEFDAYTLPSDLSKFATIASGEYIGKPHPHKGGYPAIQIGVSEKDRRVPTKGINPANLGQIYRFIPSSSLIPSLEQYYIQGYAIGINIHKAGRKQQTKMSISEKGEIVYPSKGCLLIRTNQWDEFSRVVNMVYSIGRAKINVSTSGNVYIPEIHSPLILITR